MSRNLNEERANTTKALTLNELWYIDSMRDLNSQDITRSEYEQKAAEYKAAYMGTVMELEALMIAAMLVDAVKVALGEPNAD